MYVKYIKLIKNNYVIIPFLNLFYVFRKKYILGINCFSFKPYQFLRFTTKIKKYTKICVVISQGSGCRRCSELTSTDNRRVSLWYQRSLGDSPHNWRQMLAGCRGKLRSPYSCYII